MVENPLSSGEQKGGKMFASAQYSLVLFSILFGGGCLETKDGLELNSGHSGAIEESCQCDPRQDGSFESAVEDLPENEDLPQDAISLTPMDLGLERQCSMFSRPVHFQIEKERPAVFLLQAVPGLRYCVEVYRLSGYITLSREEGETHRTQNLFRWCLERNLEEGERPAKLDVVSLTPEAEFEVKLKRGEE